MSEEDPNEHYNKKIFAASHEGLEIASQLARLKAYYRNQGSESETVDEISTLFHLRGFISLSQKNVLEKLVRRFC